MTSENIERDERSARDRSPGAEPDPLEKVLCPMCRLPVQQGAKICINCKSDLTWRRYLQVSQTTLALLTALIAVVAAVGPELKDLFASAEPRLSVILLDATASELSLLVANSGLPPGVLASATVWIEWRPKSRTPWGTVQANIKAKPMKGTVAVITSQSTQTVRLARIGGIAGATPEQVEELNQMATTTERISYFGVADEVYSLLAPVTCSLDTTFVGPRGDFTTMRPIKCGEIASFLAAAAARNAAN